MTIYKEEFGKICTDKCQFKAKRAVPVACRLPFDLIKRKHGKCQRMNGFLV
jgi:hypothetical protein